MNKTYFFLVTYLLIVSSSVLAQNRLPNLDKRFNVVVHIVNDTIANNNISETEILEDFTVLNSYFEPIGVSFEVCEFEYIANFEYNLFYLDRDGDELINLYHKKNRINVFYVGSIEKPDFAAGLATLGGIKIKDAGGIYIQKPAPGSGADVSSTLVHEMGHYFGLKHTFEGNGSELADGSNCDTEGDGICDTPADPFKEGDDLAEYVDGCKFILTRKDANGDYYDPHVGNPMSYYPGICTCDKFTEGQYLFMCKTYLLSTGIW